MSAPKTCKEWRGQYVTVTKRMETMTGTVFHPGERLKVIRRAKDGTLTLQRPAAAIIGHLDDHISFVPAEEGGKS